MSDESERCEHVKDDGERCRVTNSVNPDTGLCYFHDPERREELQRARSKGGHATAAKRADDDRAVPTHDAPDPPETLEDAVEWAAWASVQVATGRLDTSRANAVARLLKEFRQALERSESREALERIEELRERVEGGDADLEVMT